MTIDRHLTVGHLARRAGILARDADRLPALLLKARIIHDQHPIPFTGQPLHLRDPLAVERYVIPHHVGQQMMKLLLIGLRHHRCQGVTVLERRLTEQAGDILAQGLGAWALGKLHPQRGQKLL